MLLQRSGDRGTVERENELGVVGARCGSAKVR